MAKVLHTLAVIFDPLGLDALQEDDANYIEVLSQQAISFCVSSHPADKTSCAIFASVPGLSDSLYDPTLPPDSALNLRLRLLLGISTQNQNALRILSTWEYHKTGSSYPLGLLLDPEKLNHILQTDASISSIDTFRPKDRIDSTIALLDQIATQLDLVNAANHGRVVQARREISRLHSLVAALEPVQAESLADFPAGQDDEGTYQDELDCIDVAPSLTKSPASRYSGSPRKRKRISLSPSLSHLQSFNDSSAAYIPPNLPVAPLHHSLDRVRKRLVKKNEKEWSLLHPECPTRSTLQRPTTDAFMSLDFIPKHFALTPDSMCYWPAQRAGPRMRPDEMYRLLGGSFKDGMDTVSGLLDIERWDKSNELHAVNVDHDDNLELHAREIQAHFDESTRRTRSGEKGQQAEGRIFNLMSVILDDHTEVAASIEVPAAIKYHDWSSRFPSLRNGQTVSGLKILNYADAKAMTQLHVDWSGTTVLIVCLMGTKIIFTPTTYSSDKVLKTVMTCNARPGRPNSLTDEKLHGLRLSAGDAVLLPAACVHGVLTSKLSALLSANFLHDYAIPQQIETYRMEMACGDPTAQIDFVWFCWCSLSAMVNQLRDDQHEHPPRPLPPRPHMIVLAEFVRENVAYLASIPRIGSAEIVNETCDWLLRSSEGVLGG